MIKLYKKSLMVTILKGHAALVTDEKNEEVFDFILWYKNSVLGFGTYCN